MSDLLKAVLGPEMARPIGFEAAGARLTALLDDAFDVARATFFATLAGPHDNCMSDIGASSW